MFRFLLSSLALVMLCKKYSRRCLLMQRNVEVCLVVAWCNPALPINHRLSLLLLAVRTWPPSFDWQHLKIWLLCPCIWRWLNHSSDRLPGYTTAACNIKDIIVVAPFATRHKRYDHHCPSCNQRSCIAMVASRSHPCNERHALACYRIFAFCNDVKNTLVPVASCNTTCKKYSLSSLLSQMTIKNEVVVVCPCDTTCTGSLFAISHGHCSLACNTMNKLYNCCLLIAKRHKNTTSSSSLGMLAARILAIRQ